MIIILPDPTKVPLTINSNSSRASSQLGPLYVKCSPSSVGTSDARPGTACCYECCQTGLYVWWRDSDNLLVTMLSSVLVWNGTWGDWRTCNQRVVYVLFLDILAKTWNILSSAFWMKHSKALYNTVWGDLTRLVSCGCKLCGFNLHPQTGFQPIVFPWQFKSAGIR